MENKKEFTSSEQAYKEIHALCIQMCSAEPSRLSIVKNEEDNTSDPQPEAQEFLKLDEKRCGRDFKLYGFMAEIQGSVGFALSDFAEVVMYIKHNVPKAFDSVSATVQGWDRFFDADKRDAWRDLWVKNNTISAPLR
jgi:hypothetical protein